MVLLVCQHQTTVRTREYWILSRWQVVCYDKVYYGLILYLAVSRVS